MSISFDLGLKGLPVVLGLTNNVILLLQRRRSFRIGEVTVSSCVAASGLQEFLLLRQAVVQLGAGVRHVGLSNTNAAKSGTRLLRGSTDLRQFVFGRSSVNPRGEHCVTGAICFGR